MTQRPELTLYPGELIHDKTAFLGEPNRFDAPSSTTKESKQWLHGNMVDYLLGRTSIRSVAGENIGPAEDTTHFADELEHAKRDATIHLPGSDYAIPAWATQFEGAVRQIIEHEHATNDRADLQVAQIRSRQYRGQPRNIHPHMDMVNSNVRNFHFYLVADHAPTTTFDGTFTYTPHPYDGVHEDALEFYRDLDKQFVRQVGNVGITRATVDPFDIQALNAITVHEPPLTMQPGRTLLAVQFYEVTDPKAVDARTINNN